MGNERSESVFGGVEATLDDLEELYKEVHRRPELSMEEERTAALVAERRRTAGFDVTTGLGRTGVVGLLWNCPPPTLRTGVTTRELAPLWYQWPMSC